MNVFFDPFAQSEFDDAREYFEAEQEGLGEAFRVAVWDTIEWLEQYPHVGREIGHGVSLRIRKINVKRFPYRLIYAITDSGVRILAVAHGHRRPEYWINRI